MAIKGEHIENPPKTKWGLLDILIVVVMLAVAVIGVMEEAAIVKLICLALFVTASLILLFSVVSSRRSKSTKHSTVSSRKTLDSELHSGVDVRLERKKTIQGDFTVRGESLRGSEIRRRGDGSQFDTIPLADFSLNGRDGSRMPEHPESIGRDEAGNLRRKTADATVPDLSELESNRPIGDQSSKGEFDFLLSKLLAAVKDVLPAHTVGFFWANRGRNEIVLEVKLTDSPCFVKVLRGGMDDDIVSQIARHGKAEVISHINTRAEKDILRYYEDVQNVKSFVGVPVFFNHEVVGVLIADSKAEDAYGVETVSILGQFAKLVSAFIKTHTEKYDLRRDARVLATLDVMWKKLRKDLSLEAIMNTLVEAATELLDWDHIAITLYERDFNKWMIGKVVSKVKREYIPLMTEIDFERSVTGRAIRNGAYAIVESLREDVVRFARSEMLSKVGSFAVIPICSPSKCYGAVSIESGESGNYSKKDVDILQHLTTPVSSAIELLNTVNLANEFVAIDELTGTYNRKFLCKKIDEEISRATDYDTELSFVIMSVDSPDILVERYGGQGFDIIVSRVARLIRNSARQYDVVGRYDSSKFGVLLFNTGADDAFLWAEKVRRNIASHILSLGGRSFSVTVSAGISRIVEGSNRDQLINSAIQVLGKAEGNTVMVY